MENYKFIKDYTYKTGSSCPEGMIGCAPEIISFKKGDILGGISNNLSKDGKNIVSYRGNFSYTIPIEYVEIITNISDNVKIDKITPEPPTKSDSPFSSKLLGAYNKNLIIAIVLVAGYFAYKKFKK
jgi:hypothetical protein